MKKNIDNKQQKKFWKNATYVVMLVSIALASVISLFSAKKSVNSLIGEGDMQKIFSVDNETIADEVKDTKSETNREDNKKEQQVTNEVISFITQKEEETISKEKLQDKKEEEVTSKEKPQDKKEEEVTSKEKPQDKKEEEVTSKEKPQDKKEEEVTSKEKPQDKKEEVISKEKLQESKIKQDEVLSIEENDEEQAEVFLGSSDSFITPVNGDIIREFSGDKLVYFKAMDEWRIHKGLDIKSRLGTPVKAVMDGYVEDIQNDSENGATVIIRHSKKIASVYKNLANDNLVMPNQIIKQGDIIGVVGDKSRCSNDNEVHLHFEILKNEKLVNPQNYIKLKK
ncbi:MAG: peptidoglycan DD-metalloendopeptidase family protein [Clostridiales bacterium]|nr:peptidoglycan DD-metalloendopeptidase family protein [Clostridiales bacterium]